MGRKNTPEEQKISDDKRRAYDRQRNKTPERRASDRKRWAGDRQKTGNIRKKGRGTIDRPANKLKVMKHYSKQSLGCAFCGEEYIDFLQIHHGEGRKNVPHPPTWAGDHLYTWLINNNFPDNLGIQVFCANCNGGGHTHAEHAKTNKKDTKNVSGRKGKKTLKIKVFTEYSKKISNSDKPICACCGVNQTNFLTLDHIIGRKQMDSVPELVKIGYSSKLKRIELYNWIIKNDYLSDLKTEYFQILCFNCNHAKGLAQNKNVCPHKRK